MHQIHPQGGLPVVGEKMILQYDLQTGQIEKESPTKKTVEGSYSSKLEIRSDGQRVSVDGNPSRFHRRDNLFGLTKFDDCVAIYNHVLNELGLPGFTECKSINWYQGKDNTAASRAADGAIMTRIDWTKNYSVGKGNERATLRGLSTQSMGRGKLPFLYPNQNTLDWGKNSTYWYQKLYNKGHEIQRKLSKSKLKPEEKAYLETLIQYCIELGILRHEKEFKRTFLYRKNLCFYGQVNENQFKPYLQDLNQILERIEMSAVDYEMISDQLLKSSIVNSRQAANATQSYALAWLHGQPMDRSKSQYYEHLRRLRAIGVDISVPYDASKKMPQIKRERVIQFREVSVPPWYQMPILSAYEEIQLLA